VLLGPPGAGKGTQAELIKDKYSIPHISTGNILRDAVEKGTRLGKEANKFMHKGELVPDSIIFGLIKERVAQQDCKYGALFDGFPRNLAQAKMMQNMEYVKQSRKFIVFLIDVPDKEVIRRLSNRRYCPKCMSIYNLIHKIPERREKNIYYCDNCGTELIIRDDDRVDTIKNRLKIYHNSAKPMIEFFQRLSALKVIRNSGAEKDVFTEIISAIGGEE
jgi:adenylate kinase